MFPAKRDLHPELSLIADCRPLIAGDRRIGENDRPAFY